MEEWKPIKGVEAYEISNLGNVRRTRDGKPLRQKKNHISLYVDGKTYSRYRANLVYTHFVEDIKVPKFYFKDGNKTNFSFDNLMTKKQRDEALLIDYKSDMHIEEIKAKYNIENPHSIGIKLGHRRKRRIFIRTHATIEKSKKIEPTDPIILKLRDKYRKLAKTDTGSGLVKSESIRIDDVGNIRPKTYSEAYLVRQHCYNY